MNVVVMIGNSDDKLTQQDWAEYIATVRQAIQEYEMTVHGEWFSLGDKQWQNANWCLEASHRFGLLAFKDRMVEIRKKFGQDSVGWLEGRTEFI